MEFLTMPLLRFLVVAYLTLLFAGCSVPGESSLVANVAVADPAVVEPEATPEPEAQAPDPTPETLSKPWSGVPIAADDPVTLAGQLTEAERAVRDLNITGEELAWMAHMQQLAYRKLVLRPELREEVLAALPDDLRSPATANVAGAADLRSMVSPSEALPPWRIVEPAPMDELLGHDQAAQAEFGVP
jgi:hypothetical protein